MREFSHDLHLNNNKQITEKIIFNDKHTHTQ